MSSTQSSPIVKHGRPSLSKALTLALALTGITSQALANVVVEDKAYECMERVTALKQPMTRPQIVYNPEWSLRVEAICCTASGDIATGAIVASTYVVTLKGDRVVVLYKVATFYQLVHEITADAWVMSGGNRWDYQARERVGYAAEKAAWDKCEDLSQ